MPRLSISALSTAFQSSLAEDIGVSCYEARAYIDNYLNNYRGVKEYMQAGGGGCPGNRLHRDAVRPPPVYSGAEKSNFLTSAAVRGAYQLNTPIQNGGGWIKLAMIRVEKRP